MKACAANANRVQGRNAESAGKVAVRSATRASVCELEADFPGDVAGDFVKRHRAFIRLPDWARDAARDLDGYLVFLAIKREHAFDTAIQVLLAFGHAEHLGLTEGGDAVHP